MGVGTTPPGVSLLIDVELRGKNQRAARHERKRLVTNVKVIGHLVTFEVRSKVNFRRRTISREPSVVSI